MSKGSNKDNWLINHLCIYSQKKYPKNILVDQMYAKLRDVLKAKPKELVRDHRKGNKKNANKELTPVKIDLLFKEGYFSTTNQESLFNQIKKWLISLHFGFLPLSDYYPPGP